MSPIIRSSSLVFKVIFVTSLILMIAISFSVWLNLRFHEASLKKLTYEKAEIISEFIEKNVIRAMEKGKHFDIHGILKNFASYRGISKITLFRPTGRLPRRPMRRSLAPISVTSRSFEKSTLHPGRGRGEWKWKASAGKNLLSGEPYLEQTRMFSMPSRRREDRSGDDRRQLLREMDYEISSIKRDSILIAVITIGFLSSVLALLFLKFVNRPIKQLTSAMRRVEEGDLSARVGFRGRDEMGRLAENLMP